MKLGLGIEPKTWDSKQNISKYRSAMKLIPSLITPLYCLSLITCHTNDREKICEEANIHTYWFQYVVMDTKLTCQKTRNYGVVTREVNGKPPPPKRKDYFYVRPKRPTPSIEKNISTTSSQVSTPPTFNHTIHYKYSLVYIIKK